MTPVAFTWQRYHAPLPDTAQEWKIMERSATKHEATSQHPYAGKSVLDILWDDLDAVYEQLIEEGEPEAWTHTNAGKKALQTVRDWGELRGQAQGLAFAIAVIQNPYAVDVPAVKRQARERYEAATDE